MDAGETKKRSMQLVKARFRDINKVLAAEVDIAPDGTYKAKIKIRDGVAPGKYNVVALVDKLIKQRKDSIAAFEQAARQDLADKEAAELKVLQAYLPARMSADEVLAAVKTIVAEVGASGPGDMGKVMGVVKTRLAGKAEMSAVSAAVKAALAG
jgi:uncharacterized protein YqeY